MWKLGAAFVFVLALCAFGGQAKAQPLVLPCVPSGINCIPVSVANPLPTTGGGGGSGSVTSVAAGCGGVATPSPIVSTGTISALELVNAQVGTTYTVNNADCGNLTTFSNGSTIAVTLPQANTSSQFIAGWFADYQNLGAGTVTITPTTSTINGGATFTLATGQGAKIVSDGVNYQVQTGKGSSGTVTTVSVTTANGVSGSVANPTTTPAITLTLGAITPTTVNGVTIPTATDTAALLGTAQTFSAANTFSVAGAAATPAIRLSGAWLTTTAGAVAQVLIQQSGASAFNGSAAGTGLGVNNASGFTGSLLDLQINAASTFKVSGNNGNVTSTGPIAIFLSGASNGAFEVASDTSPFYMGAGLDVAWSRKAASNWRFGPFAAASPANYLLSGQESRPGTDTNVAGGNVTVESGNGTGNSTGSILSLRSPIAIGSGTGAQTLTTGLKIQNGQAVLSGYTVATLPAAGIQGGMAFVTDAVACTFLATVTGGGSAFCPVIWTGAAWQGA